MSRILLDTSAYSAFMRGDEETVQALREAESIFLTAVVLGELLAGFRRGTRRKENESLLRQFLDTPRVQVVPVDEETADRYALILNALRAAGTPVPTNDLWIAANAMQHGLKVLTKDAHFSKIPQIALS